MTRQNKIHRWVVKVEKSYKRVKRMNDYLTYYDHFKRERCRTRNEAYFQRLYKED